MENDSQKRLMLALIASFALTAVYMFVGGGGSSNPRPPEPSLDAGVRPAAAASVEQPAAPAPALSTGSAVVAPASDLPSRTLEVDRPEVHYTLLTDGAGLNSAVLQGPKMREVRHLTIPEGFALLLGKQVPSAPQMNLAEPVPGQPLPLSISVSGSAPLPAELRYAVASADDGQVTFVARTPNWEVSKRFTFSAAGFELNLTVALKNISGHPLSGELGLHEARAIDPAHEEKPSMFGSIGNLSDAVCLVKDSMQKLLPSDKPESKDHSGPVSFAGVNQQYFLSAVFPAGAIREGRCTLSASPVAREATAWFPFQVAAGETVTQSFGAFVGPKDSELLSSVPSLGANKGEAAWSPHLERAVDFGIWAVICKLMVVVLRFFHDLVGNWGLAIILLTVVVKVLLLPLTHRMLVSQEKMKKLQPKLTALKAKHPNDKEKQQQETMRVYQEAGVNPFGSCLMLLVQLPIWAALFTTLRNNFEIYQEPFLRHFLPDLTFKDPTYILPVLLGVSQIITGLLQPMAMDAAQQRIMLWFMPIFFTGIMLNYPAGLLLYIFTNNVLTVAQTYSLKKWLARPPAAVPEKRK